MSNYILSITLRIAAVACILSTLLLTYTVNVRAESETQACIEVAKRGLLEVPDDRSRRFLGKVRQDTALCRGGEKAVKYRATPWVDWQNYYGTGDASSKKEGPEALTRIGQHLDPNGRGIDGALLDLEFQRIELIKFNLFDQLTFEEYIRGRDDQAGPTLKYWAAMRLPPDNKYYQDVGGNGKQLCRGALITHRTLDGICNDLINPLMGSTGMPFGRNMQFDTTFPQLGLNDLIKNRHGDRIGLLQPDPQLISRELFTRQQTAGNGCNQGVGDPNYAPNASCDYIKAPFFNVLAAFWIQFMTHDWFSHTDEGRNAPELQSVGCTSEQAQLLGCREGDRREPSLYDQTTTPGTFENGGKTYLKRSPKTTKNLVTAWWDASQIYGFDERSQKRVQRDPKDSAKLLFIDNYLPLLPTCGSYSADCPVQPQWQGQDAAAFPDNWNIGMSFYHNLFTREHNFIVDKFREQQKLTPEADSGLRDPDNPQKIMAYKDVDSERLYHVARLVVAAEIAKIHTIEWTTQLLYDEPLYAGMNSCR